MSAFVLDCSIAMTWCFEDEASPATDAILDRLSRDSAVAPALWRWEAANVLASGVRRGRLNRAHVAVKLATLSALPITIDAESPERAWRETLMLAETEGLTVFDAAYLELALRERLELATLDSDLIRAASNIGVRTIP